MERRETYRVGNGPLVAAFREATARLADLLLPREDVSEERLHNVLLALGSPYGRAAPPTDEQAHRDLLCVLDWCTPQEVVAVRDALRRTFALDLLLNAPGSLERDESAGGSVLAPISYYDLFNGADTERCLMGHIARARGTTYNALVRPRSDPFRPIELYMINIMPGMDHEARRRAALLDTWLMDWLDARTIELPVRAE